MPCAWTHFSAAECIASFHEQSTLKKSLIIGGVLTGITIHGYKIYQKKQARKRWNSVGKDVVLIHCAGHGTTVPNLSPFVMKLQTYLRMIGMKYEMDYDTPIGPKGKFPWITLNGEDYADSTLIMEMIAEKYNKDMSSHLRSEQKAIARTIHVMMEEHMLWGIIYIRFVRDLPYFLQQISIPLPWTVIGQLFPFKHTMQRRLNVQGLGRHTHEQITEMMRKDLEALSVLLGDKDYLFGDRPSEIDCVVFAFMAQFWFSTGNSEIWKYINEDLNNLQRYTLRMKNQFWPDWENILLKK